MRLCQGGADPYDGLKTGRAMKLFWRILALAVMVWHGPAAAQDLTALARIDPAATALTDRPGGGIDLRVALSQAVPYRVFTLDGPPRLVVDFREVDFGLAPAADADRAAGVTSVSWGRFMPGWSRIVAELSAPMRLSSATVIPDAAGGAEVRAELVPTTPAIFAAESGTPPGTDWALPEPAQVDAPKVRQTGEKPLFVVLDPGHGGIDPGAEAPGMTEADLMLTFSQELAEVLRRGGLEVLLTREEDVFVPLEVRISVARAAGADLFLSLHADAVEEGIARGATVYVLDDAAEDRAATLLAEKHDRADLLAGVDLSGNDDEVANILMELARTETDPRSERLALALKTAIEAADIRMHTHPIQGAAFSVLKAPDIPSVLLEVGFLSSEADRKRIADPEWRGRMQAAILAALQAWGIADAAEARLIRQ